MQQLSKKDALNVLSAWSILEILSPRSFSNKQELAGGTQQQIIDFEFDDKPLPWENPLISKPPKDKKYFYQVVLGTIEMKKAIEALHEKYKDASRNEDPPFVSGQDIMSLLLLDQSGRLISNNSAATNISSFAWGLPKALNEDFSELKNWSSIKGSLEHSVDAVLRSRSSGNEPLSMNKATLKDAHHFTVKSLGLSEQLMTKSQFIIRIMQSDKTKNPPAPILMNSFFLDDLTQATSLVDQYLANTTLKQYLGLEVTKKHPNILENNEFLEVIIGPKNIPLAKWPSPGKHPLVLLQQAAVNIAMSRLEEGILAINAPPGTGKTTLLRDIIAAIVLKKAEALSSFSDPAEAFKDSTHKVITGSHWLGLYEIDEKLKGFEILIASSNNKAVENITAELPGLKAIDADATELRYFNTLSNSLIGSETWGMVSAILGSYTKRGEFAAKFWWDKDCGIATYLAQAAGIPQKIEEKNEAGQITNVKKPKITLECDPPNNHAHALERWRATKKRFNEKLQECNQKIAELEKIRQAIHDLEKLEIGFDLDIPLEEIIEEHFYNKPNIVARLFNLKSARIWFANNKKILLYSSLKSKVDAAVQNLGPHIINKQFFMKSREEMHLVSPWVNNEIQTLRDQLFIESIKLTKAFIDEAAKPLRHNLGILMRILGKKDTPSSEILKRITDLWASFFLVVPSISSTFSSISSMLTDVPSDSFGWLIVDEAGQALPQSAVGAIMRSKRAIVTGDPMQILPVVSLPEALTKRICKRCEVDPDRFNAPVSSAQTLADNATPYFTEFHGQYGSRTVGFPLLVHRRCAEPMFTIANSIAYAHNMVEAKKSGKSLIRDCLGNSQWFDIKGSAEGKQKWCKEEGEKVVELLLKLKSAGVPPDIYIISPFKDIVYNLKYLIKNKKLMWSWVKNEEAWLEERIGTVHTVQGREAEAVILILGVTRPDQSGSRKWAGYPPNLLNVAVTRAKEVLYVIGNREEWKKAGVFESLHNMLMIGNEDADILNKNEEDDQYRIS